MKIKMAKIWPKKKLKIVGPLCALNIHMEKAMQVISVCIVTYMVSHDNLALTISLW